MAAAIVENAPVATETLITGEALAEMGDIGRCELVKGKVIKHNPNYWSHGHCVGCFSRALESFVNNHQLGEILVGEVGIYTQRSPDTIRGADVIFISNERFAQVKPVLSEVEGSPSFLDVALQLVIEVMSPDDRWTEVKQKIREYFSIGVSLVWVADPTKKTVSVCRSLTEVRLFSENDTLSGEEVLPGFSVSVTTLFAD